MYEVKEIKISPLATIREALQVIDRGAMKIALVIDTDGRLTGTLTDGDIRRGFLSGLTLDDPIESIYHRDPVTASASDSREKIIEIALSRRIYQIPIVDEQGFVVRLAEIDHLIRKEKHPNLVFLMAGGLGQRLRPLTNDIPKPMLSVGGRPILETVIYQFKKHGYSRFAISINYKSDQIKEHFGDGSRLGVEICYISENQRMGTAGALGLMESQPDRPFFVMNGDILTTVDLESLMDYHIRNGSSATMCIREFGLEVPYGVVRLNKESIVAIEEKPVQQFYVNAGIYVLSPEMLRLLPAGEALDMTRLFEMAVEKGLTTLSFPIREFWMDIGNPADYERANLEFKSNFNV
ncbi:MAG: nucleotidyltransferase family protein [Bacteroidales bacterium]|nr:nucleotidyltransferase family protein [Bacteroidales bacterium]MDD3385776.1 nucleotidyltransferase family protein [Bacteroidales bacterium]NLO68423.1 CBS domain-containing protein [Bacteroidales bacterium]